MQPSDEIEIAVERMIRFCLLAEMTYEYSQMRSPAANKLPLHLTRFGALVFETAGFLYSLFESRIDSINLLRTWGTIDSPFKKQLADIQSEFEPFKIELNQIRNRISFHGSISRSHEKTGLGVFDVESGRAPQFVDLIRKVQLLSEEMIKWYCENFLENGVEVWNSFVTELKEYNRGRIA